MPIQTVPIFQSKPIQALPGQAVDVAEIQRKSALANALMQGAITPQQGQMVGSGPYQMMTRTGVTSALGSLAQALIARNLNQQVSQGQQKLSDAYAQQLQSMFGGGSSGVSTPAPASQAPAMPPPSPQGPYAGGMNQPPSTPQPPAPAIAASGSAAAPMNPLGVDPGMAQFLYMQDPAKYVEQFVAPAYKPADIFGKLRAAGVDPGSPLGRQIAQTNLAKENYIAPINAREGSTLVDPFTMQPRFEAPKEGVGIQYGQNGPTAYEVPGYRQARAGITGAETGAKEMNTPRVVPTQAGGSAFVYPSQVAGLPPALGGNPNTAVNPGGGSGQPAAPSAQPGEAPMWQSMPKLSIPSGTGAPGAYSEAIMKGAANKALELRTKFGEEADLADQKIVANKEALRVVSKSETGPLTETLTKWRGILKEIGVPDSLIGGDKVAPTQELKKYLVNNAIQGAQLIYGPRMTQREVEMQKNEASPSDQMALDAIQDLVKFQNIQNDYVKRRSQDFDQYLTRGGDPLRFESWYTSKAPLSAFAEPPTAEEIKAELKRRGVKF